MIYGYHIEQFFFSLRACDDYFVYKSSWIKSMRFFFLDFYQERKHIYACISICRTVSRVHVIMSFCHVKKEYLHIYLNISVCIYACVCVWGKSLFSVCCKLSMSVCEFIYRNLRAIIFLCVCSCTCKQVWNLVCKQLPVYKDEVQFEGIVGRRKRRPMVLEASGSESRRALHSKWTDNPYMFWN